jgi:hypothetical protein
LHSSTPISLLPSMVTFAFTRLCSMRGLVQRGAIGDVYSVRGAYVRRRWILCNPHDLVQKKVGLRLSGGGMN